MEKILGIVTFGAIIMFIAPAISALFGGFSGWVVGLFFEEQVRAFLEGAGINTAGLSMFDIGLALGFIGGYLKTTTHQQK